MGIDFKRLIKQGGQTLWKFSADYFYFLVNWEANPWDETEDGGDSDRGFRKRRKFEITIWESDSEQSREIGTALQTYLRTETKHFVCFTPVIFSCRSVDKG